MRRPSRMSSGGVRTSSSFSTSYGPAFRDGYPHTVLVARCKNGNSDETRSSPCDRVGSDNPDLITARTQRSQVIDCGLQRAARKSGRDGPACASFVVLRPAVDFSSLEEVLIVLVPARPAAPRPEAAPPGRAREMKTARGHRRAARGAGAADDAGGAADRRQRSRVNLVLVAVVYVALAFGPVTGLLAGTAGGLVQDALAGGIVGIGGFVEDAGRVPGRRAGRAVHRVAAGAAVRDVRGRDVRARGCASRRCTRWSSRGRSGCSTRRC